MKIPLVICLAIALAAGSSTAQEQLRVELDMNSLPSEQGWLFGDTSDDQNDYYHVDGTALYLDSTSLGWGFNTGAFYYYRLAALAGVPNWSLTVRARVHSSYPPDQTNPWGFCFLLSLDGTVGGFAISPSEIRLAGEAVSRPYNGLDWHTYSVLASQRSGTYSLYIDGVLFETLPLAGALTDQIVIGDSTNSGWSSGEISHVTAVLSNSEVVPNESESWGGVKALYR